MLVAQSGPLQDEVEDIKLPTGTVTRQKPTRTTENYRTYEHRSSVLEDLWYESFIESSSLTTCSVTLRKLKAANGTVDLLVLAGSHAELCARRLAADLKEGFPDYTSRRATLTSIKCNLSNADGTASIFGRMRSLFILRRLKMADGGQFSVVQFQQLATKRLKEAGSKAQLSISSDVARNPRLVKFLSWMYQSLENSNSQDQYVHPCCNRRIAHTRYHTVLLVSFQRCSNLGE